MKRTVLILSNSKDAHVDILEKKMDERGTKYLRWDMDTMLIRPFGYSFKIGVRSSLGSCLTTNVEITDGSQPFSIWYRRPIPPVFASEVEPHIKDYVEREFDGWLSNICLNIPGFWVSPYMALQQSRNKLHQLRTALRIGLAIPETLVTNRLDLAKEFWDISNGRVVAKAFSVQNVERGDDLLIIDTKRVLVDDLSGIMKFPCILQREIERVHELRVVVIGRRVFSFGIKPRVGAVGADWRSLGLQNLEHFEATLSRSSELALLSLLDHYGLSFCSADFLVTEKGEEYFVDLNPNGQWLWLEFMTGVSLSDRFLDMLEAGELLR